MVRLPCTRDHRLAVLKIARYNGRTIDTGYLIANYTSTFLSGQWPMHNFFFRTYVHTHTHIPNWYLMKYITSDLRRNWIERVATYFRFGFNFRWRKGFAVIWQSVSCQYNVGARLTFRLWMDTSIFNLTEEFAKRRKVKWERLASSDIQIERTSTVAKKKWKEFYFSPFHDCIRCRRREYEWGSHYGCRHEAERASGSDRRTNLLPSSLFSRPALMTDF